MSEVPFTSERKLMTTLQADTEDAGGIDVVTKGAPDVLLARCTAERDARAVLPLTAQRRSEDGWGAIVLSLLLQVAVVELPFLNDAFRTTPLSLGDWGICVALASVVLWADELRKLAARRSRPAAAPAGA